MKGVMKNMTVNGQKKLKAKEVQMQRKNFFMIANRIFEIGLKPREFIVYCCLVRHTDKNGICFPSRRLISEECRMDVKTVDTAIKNLCDAGLVQKQHRHRTDGTITSNRYIVNLLQ